MTNSQRALLRDKDGTVLMRANIPIEDESPPPTIYIYESKGLYRRYKYVGAQDGELIYQVEEG